MARGNVLAIDDELFFRSLYEELLSPEGFAVHTAASGKEAIEHVKSKKFDVVIADMVMPEWDGIRTLEEIKKIVPEQEVIMVTHISDLETAVEAMKSGASDYIMKPIKGEALLYSIRRLLKRHKVLEEHSRLVKENIEFFEILSTYKKCLDILSNNRYTRLIDVIVDAIMVETGAKQGIFWMLEDEEAWSWRAAGHASRESMNELTLPSSDSQWKEKLKYGLPFSWPSDKDDQIFIPLMPKGGRQGVVEISGKRGKRQFDQRDLKVAAILAEFSQVALSNAYTIHELEDHSFKNEEYGVYTFSFFRDYLAKQIYVASRYHRPFSIICMKIDNWSSVVENFGTNSIRNSIRQLISKIMGVIRDSDAVSYHENGLFYIILAETDYFGSLMALQRIEDGLTGFKYVSDGERSMPLSIMMMSASYPRDGIDVNSLITNVTRKTEEVSQSLYHQLGLTEKSFWESVAEVLKYNRKMKKPLEEEVSPYVYEGFSKKTYENMISFFAEEVFVRPFIRGVLFIGTDEVSPDSDFCKKIASISDMATRVYLVGKKGEENFDISNIIPVYLAENEKPFPLIISLNEEVGYIFLGIRGKDGSISAFHTSDIYLVEKLVAKLREHYMLQWI